MTDFNESSPMQGNARNQLHHVRVIVAPDGRLSRRDAAAYLSLSPRTLANWQGRGLGPRSHRVGGRRFYYLSDLEAFVAGHQVAA
jgi:hypothetical protein